MVSIALDKIDRRILAVLQQNARMSNLDLAEQVGLSATPCARRVKRLEDEGLIQGYNAQLNQQMLGLKLTAILSISMDKHTPDRFENFAKEVKDYPEVVECSVVTGQSADLLLKVVVPDMAYYEQFLLGRLTKIEGVTGVHTSFVLRNIISKQTLPLNLDV